MIMSRKWKKISLSISMSSGKFHNYQSVRFIRKAHMCIVVFNYMGFDSMARFISEVSIHWRRVHILQNIHIMLVFRTYNT
jgi:hypothetical protein